MKTADIFSEWGTKLTTSTEELMDCDEKWLQEMLISRNLLHIQGVAADISDKDLYALVSRFGRAWTSLDYTNPLATRGVDPTIVGLDTTHPISYFKSTNNAFKARDMDYHADMPHIGPNSYPARALHMTTNTTDGSGITSWLNLELVWERLPAEEKRVLETVQLEYHDMYKPGERTQIRPLLKTNPATGKLSPDLNCVWNGYPKDLAWIRSIIIDGTPLPFAEGKQFMAKTFARFEQLPNCIYDHHWADGDLIVYDNWFNVHKRTAVSDVSRLLRRISFNITNRYQAEKLLGV